LTERSSCSVLRGVLFRGDEFQSLEYLGVLQASGLAPLAPATNPTSCFDSGTLLLERAANRPCRSDARMYRSHGGLAPGPEF
jgi:hypothetical protein